MPHAGPDWNIKAAAAAIRTELDANGDGVVDRPEMLRSPVWRGAADRLDGNGDGRIDAAEIAGSLAGSTPQSRGGAGSESWIAPPAGWTMEAGGLVIDREGSGFLPFTPRPGRLYRLSIRGEMLGGGLDWVGFGFTRAADPGQVMQQSGAYARMLQRQDTSAKPNCVCFTAATDGPWQEVDRHPGPAFVRSIIFDTRGPRWTAWFFLGDTLLCRHAYDGPLDMIAYVAISGIGQAKACLHEVSLAECRPGVPATPDPGGG